MHGLYFKSIKRTARQEEAPAKEPPAKARGARMPAVAKADEVEEAEAVCVPTAAELQAFSAGMPGPRPRPVAGAGRRGRRRAE